MRLSVCEPQAANASWYSGLGEFKFADLTELASKAVSRPLHHTRHKRSAHSESAQTSKTATRLAHSPTSAASPLLRAYALSHAIRAMQPKQVNTANPQ